MHAKSAPHPACCWATAARVGGPTAPSAAQAAALLHEYADSDAVTARLVAAFSTVIDHSKLAPILPASCSSSHLSESWAAAAKCSVTADGSADHFFDDHFLDVTPLPHPSAPSLKHAMTPLELRVRNCVVTDDDPPHFKPVPAVQAAQLADNVQPTLDCAALLKRSSTARPINAGFNTPRPGSGPSSPAVPLQKLSLSSLGLRSSAVSPRHAPPLTELRALGRDGPNGARPSLSRRPSQANRRSLPSSPLPRVSTPSHPHATTPTRRTSTPTRRTPAPPLSNGRQAQPGPLPVVNLISDDEDDGDNDAAGAEHGAPSPMAPSTVMDVDDDEVDVGEHDDGTRLDLPADMARRQREKESRQPDTKAYIRKLDELERRKQEDFEQRTKTFSVKKINDVVLNDTAYARIQVKKQREKLKQESRQKKLAEQEKRNQKRKEKQAEAAKRKRALREEKRGGREDEDTHEVRDEDEDEANSDFVDEDLPLKRTRTRSPLRSRDKQPEDNSGLVKVQEIREAIGRNVDRILSRGDAKLIADWAKCDYEMFQDGETAIDLSLDPNYRGAHLPRGTRVLRLTTDGIWNIQRAK